MTSERVVLASLSAAMDGGFTAVADVSTAMITAGAADDYRLIGGVTVLLHVQRLGLVLPLRATADADFGVPPHVLRRPELVQAIEALGYGKPSGNRWERPIDAGPRQPGSHQPCRSAWHEAEKGIKDVSVRSVLSGAGQCRPIQMTPMLDGTIRYNTERGRTPS